jgi:hypothetical protein
MFPQPVGQALNGHPVHAWRSLIGANPPVRANQVLGLTYLLHQIDCQGSLWVQCRERLLPILRREMSSARLAAAVVWLIILLLRVHRNLPSAPCTRRFSPSPGWATLASADFSTPVPLHGCRGSPVCTDQSRDLLR